MKLRNEKEIERLSVAHANMVSDASFPEWHGREASFRRGYTQAQQDLLSQAVEGFNENWFSRKLNVICNDYEMDEHKETWQASRLSMAKEIEKKDAIILSQEKERQRTEAFWKEKLGDLQKENEELRESLFKMCLERNKFETFYCDEKRRSETHCNFTECERLSRIRVEMVKKENEELTKALSWCLVTLPHHTISKDDYEKVKEIQSRWSKGEAK